MDVSLCVASYRPGFNLLIESLKDIKFDGEWECVFADELYDQRKHDVEAHKGDLPLKHVKAINHPYACPSSTFNTAIRNTDPSSKLLLIVGDYSIYPSDYLQKHWNTYKEFKDTTLVSSYIDLECPEIKEDPRMDDFSIFKEEMTKEKFLGQKVIHPEERHMFVHNWLDGYKGFLTGEFTQGLIGIPRDLMIRINGFDEIFNNGKGRGDFDVVHRASLMGHRFILDTSLRIYRCAHPHKEVEDLRFPFTEKKNFKTREENKKLFFEKAKLLSRKHKLVNSHKGLRDLRWIEDRTILVQGGGAEVCTRKWVKILQHAGLDVLHNEINDFRFRNITDIIIYGVSIGDFQWTSFFRGKCRIWFWFTGSDCWHAINNTLYMGNLPKHENYRFLAISERVRKELKTVGIEAETIMDYEDDVTADLEALDKEDNWEEECYPFTVLIYMPSDNKDFYHYDLMKEVVEEFKGNSSIKFVFYGNKELLDLPGYDDFADPHNCHQRFYIGGEEKKQLYKETYVYLRHTEHDGLPEIIVELKKMGRHVIMNYPYPHCIVAYTKDEIVKHINRLYKEFKDEGRPLDVRGKLYYRQKYSKENFIKRFIEIIYGESCLKKWEGEE